MTYHLIAFAVNATCYERAEVEWTLASQGPDAKWYEWNGHEVVPFHVGIPIDFPTLNIPPGWIEHLHALARRDMRQYAEPAVDLAALLGLHTAKQPTKPFARRI